MRGVIALLPQYAFVALYTEAQGQLYLYLYHMRENHKLVVFKNRLPIRIFGSEKKREEVAGKNYIIRGFIICIRLVFLQRMRF